MAVSQGAVDRMKSAISKLRNGEYAVEPNLPTVRFKKLTSTAETPTRGSSCAAGYDLYAVLTECNKVLIAPQSSYVFHTGIAMEIPPGYFGAVYARSGLATKKGLRPSNCVGVIDSDYRGEISVCLFNDSDSWQEIHNHDRIAQIVITPYQKVHMIEVNELNDTKRGTGGFGSTGN